MKLCLGRHVYGLAALGFGIVTLVWHSFNIWQQIHALGNLPHREALVYVAAIAEIFGGVVIQWRRTARIGTVVLGIVYLVFALLWIPNIAAHPAIYNNWANLFEQLSMVAGALILYSSIGPAGSAGWMERGAGACPGNIARSGYCLFGLCVVSFTLAQIFYLSGTEAFVPKWIPPGQAFWAVLTTVAFALAAIALFSGFLALLASRLVTIMILGFGLLIWLPALFLRPHALISWAGNAENLAIAGSAWIVADLLGRVQPAKLAWVFRPMPSTSPASTVSVMQ